MKKFMKQGCSFSPTLFFIYIDKLEGCLEEADCVGTILAEIVIILLLYTDDIVLLARCLSDLDKWLILLKDFCSTKGMTINTNKKKVMIIKPKDTYANFVSRLPTWQQKFFFLTLIIELYIHICSNNSLLYHNLYYHLHPWWNWFLFLIYKFYKIVFFFVVYHYLYTSTIIWFAPF